MGLLIDGSNYKTVLTSAVIGVLCTCVLFIIFFSHDIIIHSYWHVAAVFGRNGVTFTLWRIGSPHLRRTLAKFHDKFTVLEGYCCGKVLSNYFIGC